MGNIKTQLLKSSAGLLVASTLFAVGGCASDTTLPPFHTSVKYDPSHSHTYLSEVPPTNAPSTRDWKTNQLVGVRYGTSQAEGAAPNGTGTAAGAASSPSGTSSGSAGGVTTGAGVSAAPGVGPTPGSGTPGTIVGNPPGTGIVGGAPTLAPAPSRAVNPSAGVISPSISTGLSSPASGLSSTPLQPGTLASPGIGGIGITNRPSVLLFTNTVIGQTNSLPGTGLNRPGP
jgi:hypothetical protein